MAALVDLLDQSWEKIAELEKALRKQHRNSEVSRQLEKIPGVGAATALTAARGDGKQFRNGRQFSAALVPQQDDTEVRLGRISKRDDPAQQFGPWCAISWRLRKAGQPLRLRIA